MNRFHLVTKKSNAQTLAYFIKHVSSSTVNILFWFGSLIYNVFGLSIYVINMCIFIHFLGSCLRLNWTMLRSLRVNTPRMKIQLILSIICGNVALFYSRHNITHWHKFPLTTSSNTTQAASLSSPLALLTPTQHRKDGAERRRDTGNSIILSRLPPCLNSSIAAKASFSCW